ncbi:type II toxin-antitoxin system VapC family toxin [Calidithermus roseus]|uniref:PIN domain protein n=1 Tax=Calidithermus roseus TaxID=1644118 RepID=A0A399ES51_9DEIN|nr:type II toxin-antitoxin system VapC family toxin [Calidithermus roseus]RIH85879.1 PIN domain protein [Calidithermus roseus]
MRLLLDTHTLLWLDAAPELLSARATEHIRDRANEVYVSSITAWELALKYAMGKLPEAQALVQEFHRTLSAYSFLELPFTGIHALQAGLFQTPHRDPFDRALAAQALHEQLTLVSKDSTLDQFDVPRLW